MSCNHKATCQQGSGATRLNVVGVFLVDFYFNFLIMLPWEPCQVYGPKFSNSSSLCLVVSACFTR